MMYQRPQMAMFQFSRTDGRVLETYVLSLALFRFILTSFIKNTQMDISFPLEYPLPVTHPLSSQRPLSKQSAKVLAPELNSSTPEVIQQSRAACDIPPLGKGPKPILYIRTSETHLHPRATEFYIVSASSCGQLKLQITWDSNVFEQAVVEEWLEEFQAAAEWYLGREPSEVRGRL